MSLSLALLLAAQAPVPPLYLGADLSYVNEMEDCGAVYGKAGGGPIRSPCSGPPAAISSGCGSGTTRNGPDTAISPTSGRRSPGPRRQAPGASRLPLFGRLGRRRQADPPAAWAGLGTEAQAKALYDYTLDMLAALDRDGLMPEMVQVGNETNPELMGGEDRKAIDWARNAALLNAGIRAVRDAGARPRTRPRVMLHIAQPENVEPWFEAATAAG